MSDPWRDLLAATENYPGALRPPALHGYLTAWSIDFENRDGRPWLEKALGVDRPERIAHDVRSLGEECIDIFSEEIGLFEYKLPPFNDESNAEHWAQSWCRGFRDAVALNRKQWEQYSSHFTVARSLLAISMLASVETYSEVTGKPGSGHPEFVARQGPKTIPGAVSVIGASVLGDAGVARDLFRKDDDVDSGPNIELPEFDAKELRGYSNEDLMKILVTLHDLVPENVVHECARRDTGIVPLLREHIHNQMVSEDHDEGRWWGVLHCLHILGLIPGPGAARALLDALEVRQTDPDDYVWEWVSGGWPALFENKHEHARSALIAIAGNKACEWALRADVMECLAADAGEREAHLDRIAAVAADETEKDLVREMAGNVLLDYPRDRHRDLLHGLAERQARRGGLGVHFDETDVHFAYWEQGGGRPPRTADPWRFYEPAAILKRQRRWLREDREAEQRALLNESAPGAPAVNTYMRSTPKIGRNDSCPCGSGKKYKKCCLNNRS